MPPIATPFRNQAIGAGNAAEQIVGTNGTVTIPAQRKLVITDWVMTYQGAGILRIREDNLAGAIVIQHRFSGDGEIQGQLGSPIEIVNNTGSPMALVITEEGAFANSLFVSGRMETI